MTAQVRAHRGDVCFLRKEEGADTLRAQRLTAARFGGEGCEQLGVAGLERDHEVEALLRTDMTDQTGVGETAGGGAGQHGPLLTGSSHRPTRAEDEHGRDESRSDNLVSSRWQTGPLI